MDKKGDHYRNKILKYIGINEGCEENKLQFNYPNDKLVEIEIKLDKFEL